jgi:hypothetical protein
MNDVDPSISVGEIRDRIRARAHQIWEAEGRPSGQEEKHWLAAEKEVLEEVDRSGATGPAPGDAVAREPRPGADPARRQEDLLDEAVEETFPASDPISPKQIT